jgi:hypothetical protein
MLKTFKDLCMSNIICNFAPQNVRTRLYFSQEKALDIELKTKKITQKQK